MRRYRATFVSISCILNASVTLASKVAQEIQSAPIFQDRSSAYLSPSVARRVPGATLTLRFTDIDLAGRLEPWRIRKFTNVRFDRNMAANPLRLYFDYTLTDSQGRILTSGSKALVDGDYIQRYIYYPQQRKVGYSVL